MKCYCGAWSMTDGTSWITFADGMSHSASACCTGSGRTLADAIARVEALEECWQESLARLDAAIADLRHMAEHGVEPRRPEVKRNDYWEPR